MANFKRKKARNQIRCSMCTDGRQGNSLQAGVGRTDRIREMQEHRDIEAEQLRELPRKSNPERCEDCGTILHERDGHWCNGEWR